MFRFLKSTLFVLKPRLFEPTEYWVDREKKIIYLVTSKCACSSIKKLLYKHRYGTDYMGKNIHTDEDVKREFRQHNLSNLDLDKYFKFTVVREPESRLVSTYINKFLQRHSYKDGSFEYNDYLFGVFDKNEDFRSFIRKISIIPKVYMDRHFVPLSYLIEVKSKMDFDAIYKIENIGKLASYFGESSPIENSSGDISLGKSKESMLREARTLTEQDLWYKKDRVLYESAR